MKWKSEKRGMLRVVMTTKMAWQVNEEVSRDKTGEAESWFQRRSDANINERCVIFNEQTVGGRERMTADEERVLREGWREIRLWR